MKVVVYSGHMLDLPDREIERFPARKEQTIKNLMAQQLDQWSIGTGDIAISSAARGGDILFAELCLERQAQVHLLIALPREEFIEASVRIPGTDWVKRFDQVCEQSQVQYLHEKPGAVDEKLNVFERTNLWCLEMAHEMINSEINQPSQGYALLLWDEKPVGDGPGGTAHFARTVKSKNWALAIINPLKY